MNAIFDTLPPGSALRALLLGEVPDVDWQLRRTDKLVTSWERAKDQWQFFSSWFRSASADGICRVPLMPVLSFIALLGGQVPSLTFAVDVISSSPLAHTGIEARAYSAYTGFLREMHVGLYLSQYGTVTKNPIADMQRGIDWTFDGRKIAVRQSTNFWRRKSQKVASDVIVLTATPSSGLSLVAIADIEAKILSSS